MSLTTPVPSQRGHMPPARSNTRSSVWPSPFSIVMVPEALTDGTLNENALEDPMCGLPIRLYSTRSIAWASVTVPTVERTLPPSRSWSTRMAVVSPSSTSTSGLAIEGMKPCTNAL